MTGINQKVSQVLSIVIETVRIVKELMEIWLNEVCNTCYGLLFYKVAPVKGSERAQILSSHLERSKDCY